MCITKELFEKAFNTLTIQRYYKQAKIKSNIYLSSYLSVCLSESNEQPGRWTNPHQIWYGGLTLQGPGHRLCFGPQGGPPGSGVH